MPEALLYPTLVLLVGVSANPLTAKLRRWVTADIQPAFHFATFAEEETTPGWVSDTGQSLNRAATGELVRRKFVPQSQLSKVRITLVCGSEEIEHLQQALAVIIEAQEIWRVSVPNLRLECQIVLFGPDRGGRVGENTRSLSASMPHGTSQPLILYLGNCIGALALEGRSVQNAAEALTALLSFSDASLGSPMRMLAEQEAGGRFYVALEEFYGSNLNACTGHILYKAVRTELNRFLLGQPINQAEARQLLAIFDSARFGNVANAYLAQSEAFQRDVFERALPHLMLNASRFVSPQTGFGPLLEELAAVAEQVISRSATQESFRTQEKQSMFQRFLAFLRRLLQLDQPSTESSVHAVPGVNDGEDARVRFLPAWLRELGRGFSEVPTDPQSLADPMFSSAFVMHVHGYEPLEISDASRQRLEDFARDWLVSRALGLPVLVALQSLTRNDILNEARATAYQLGRELFQELRLRVRDLWIAEAWEKDRHRWDEKTWQDFLYCNQPPPAPHVLSYCFTRPLTLIPEKSWGLPEVDTPLNISSASAYISAEQIFFLRLVRL